MAKLEDIKPGVHLKGVLPQEDVQVVDAKWHGSDAIELIYKRSDGQPGSQLIFREEETGYDVIARERRLAFSADGDLFRLAAEAYRIKLAHLFDPVLAVHTSLIEPLPHQITAVYGEMMQRQPLRFLLADDPGAGKTIMAGLLIKELMARGDVRRCLICVPGNLAGQWQDELYNKFQMRFDILTRDTFQTAVTGNAFLEHDLAIVRLDQVARDEVLQQKLKRSEWDLSVVDEAHKMSAHFWGGKLEETKRYKLGELLGDISRNFLLMTATPHNGKEEDFQLFLRLLDQDRFEGRFREGVHEVDISDIMRRMVKENLRKFDGRPLFPERRAYTVDYPLSPQERELYEAVTAYVREEFNRAEKLLDDKRKGTVGFALTILQRRLASSPEAIYQSLKRRRERLEERVKEVELAKQDMRLSNNLRYYDEEDLEAMEDAPADELEELEDEVMDAATAAMTITELKAEIDILKGLEMQAHHILRSGVDQKWAQLATILHDDGLMFDDKGNRRKLVIFSEHRDTLRYLVRKIGLLFGRNEENLVTIHGSVPREERRAVEDRFRNDPKVHFLVATDAAAEGINLQRAHLMMNYDLPWNPNRLEQRFGRIHRIGQSEVCHLWNLVSKETREGYVYERLLRKLEVEGRALDGKVFDILGELFEREPLRKLLIEAIRYGEQPEVRAKLERAVDSAVDQKRVRQLLNARSLAADNMDTSQIMEIRGEMERYAARRLQPHYIQSFFTQAFGALGGTLREREPGRFAITHVPAIIRDHAKELGTPVPVLPGYERICFEKDLIAIPGKPQADFICPGHQLLDAVLDLTLEKHRGLLNMGSVLVDPTDPGDKPRVMFFIEGAVRDATQHTISREVHFIEINEEGDIRLGGSAPYLDYRPAAQQELEQVRAVLEEDWLNADALEAAVISAAVKRTTSEHLRSVRERRETLIEKTMAAVHQRLTKEINYWDRRAAQLRKEEQVGKVNARLNSTMAQRRADDISSRLKRRKKELENSRQISAAPPVIIGGALIVPAGCFMEEGQRVDAQQKRVVELAAMQAVMEAEIELGNEPKDVSKDNVGYDVESLDTQTGRLRFIEVKGRRKGAETVTLSRNEILTAINSPESFILALVTVEDGEAREPIFISAPAFTDPGFLATSVTFKLKALRNIRTMKLSSQD